MEKEYADNSVASHCSVAFLPCKFCGESASKLVHSELYRINHADWCWFSGKDFKQRASLLEPDEADQWNTRCVDGHVVTFHWEPPGVIGETCVWVVCAEGYMYGPCERWQDVETIIRNEWKADSCLVG